MSTTACMPLTGDDVGQPGRVQVLQDQSPLSSDPANWGQVCQPTWAEGDVWHSVPAGGWWGGRWGLCTRWAWWEVCMIVAWQGVGCEQARNAVREEEVCPSFFAGYALLM